MINNKQNQKLKNNQFENFGEDRGITLIALVITIIVLLILAGISISMLSGDNSILQKATDAKTNTDNTQIKEKIRLAYSSALTKDIVDQKGEVQKSTFEDELKNEFPNKIITIKNSIDNKEWIVTIDGVTENVSIGQNTQTVLKVAEHKNEKFSTNTELEDSLGNKITVPAGFKITSDSPNSVTGGIIIEDATYTNTLGSQFVWIPVNNINEMVMCKNNNKDGHICNIQINDFELKCISDGASNDLCGKLYATECGDGKFNSNLSTQTYTKNDGLREPDLADSQEENEGYITYHNSYVPSEVELKSEFYKMAFSVAQYKGFYVARYELGIENEYPVSKNANTNSSVTTATSNHDSTKKWYGLYKKQKDMYSASNLNIQSTMIWGSQYDAMVRWIGSGATTSNSDSFNKEPITGKEDDDVLKNIYDLYGCHYEWTMEAGFDHTRIVRGGFYYASGSPSSRNLYGGFNAPFDGNDYVSSRTSFYIK